MQNTRKEILLHQKGLRDSFCVDFSERKKLNNTTTAKLSLRNSESKDVLTLQILGLIAREGQGAFFLTEKFERLQLAIERRRRGYMLLRDDELLIEECRVLIPLH